MIETGNDPDLAAVCVEHLQKAFGPEVTVHLDHPERGRRAFNIRVGTKPPMHFTVETKHRALTRNQAQHLILQLKHLPGEAILFANWIPEPIADELRKAGQFFVDAQGNILVRKPPHVVIDIRNKRPPRPLKAEPGRLIEPGGLKVIHYLLTQPKAADDPLRTIAERAEVGLATAHAIMRELHRNQWVLPTAGYKRRLGDPKQMLELFVRGYALKLRPACIIGRYRHQQRAPEHILENIAQRLADEGRWAVTGGLAAKHFTHYLETDTVEVFVDEQAMAHLKAEPMLRDETNGNVTLLRLFGKAAIAAQQEQSWPVATPLLVYAELLQTGGAREFETAQMIYERFLEPILAHGA